MKGVRGAPGEARVESLEEEAGEVSGGPNYEELHVLFGSRVSLRLRKGREGCVCVCVWGDCPGSVGPRALDP